MAYIKRPLLAADVAIDESTNALLVALAAGVSIGSVNVKDIAGSTIDPATEGKQDTGNTSLASILAKIIAAPATAAKQDTQITAEQAILAKLIAAPATEAKQDTQITAEQAILAKLIAAPATAANQASILAKIIAAPATEAKQDTVITAMNLLSGDGLTFTRVKIDQTGGAGASVLIGALASNYTRLHAMLLTIDTAGGTVTLEDSDGTDITGPMPFDQYGGFLLPYEAHPDGTPITAIGKGMSINTSQKAFGHAIVSQSTRA